MKCAIDFSEQGVVVVVITGDTKKRLLSSWDLDSLIAIIVVIIDVCLLIRVVFLLVSEGRDLSSEKRLRGQLIIISFYCNKLT